jgi:Helix-turn-helix domain
MDDTQAKLKRLKKRCRRITQDEQIESGFAALEATGLDREQIEDIARGIGLEGEDMALSVATARPFRGATPILVERSAKVMSKPTPTNEGFADRDRRMLSVVKALLEKMVSDMTVQEAVQSQDADHKEMVRRLVEAQGSLDDIQGLLDDQRTVKQWYTPVEVAEILGRKPFTVREWCRLGRINARKRPTGRGDADEWEISHDEVERYRNHGLLPIPAKY